MPTWKNRGAKWCSKTCKSAAERARREARISNTGWVTPEGRAELVELVDDYLALMVDDATRQHFNYRMVDDVLGWVAKAFDTRATPPESSDS